MATDITDITWADMTAAGIDIDLVRRQPTQLGTDEYVWQSGDRKVAFGPAVDLSDGGTEGWDIAAYDEVDETWEQFAQEYATTEAEALAIVARYAK